MKHPPRNPALLRKVGNPDNAPHRNARKVNANAAMPAGQRREQRSKHQSGAISTVVVDRTLGASNRQGWRLACTPEERKRHGSVVTRNDAAFYPPVERPAMRNISPGRNGWQQLTERTAVQ